eukprot:TRINITY_DN9512_c0_g1_i1.p1 TRINITY_DN9512_c0_g1~~TRINITY_DN9512_c0_g1_i1.p1  ORF type:complete len:574 (-),score=108.91 TRINITY_DN9512_c0_g1_i1:1774-3495(-)
MIITSEYWSGLFEMIREDSIQNPGLTVMIFSAVDCDSLCAVHILTKILSRYSIAHRVSCVDSYEALQDSFKQTINQTIKTVVLVNCGGNIDLFELFELESHDHITFYIFDSHRPYNQNNIENKRQILLVDDGTPPPAQEESENLEEDPKNFTYWGNAAALVLYYFARELNVRTDEMLWFGILGLTDQFIHQRISLETYLNNHQDVKKEVLDNMPVNQHHLDCSISAGPDFLFFLYRHWTLYDSMTKSRYIAVKFHLWEQSGMKRFDEFLARMGIPLAECKQKYSDMRQDIKHNLQQRMNMFVEDYNIHDCCFPSFVRILRGSNLTSYDISAADVVYAVTALLERSKWRSVVAKSTDNNGTSTSNNSLSFSSGSSQNQSAPSQSVNQDQSQPDTTDRQANDDKKSKVDFWYAYDALKLPKNANKLDEGLKNAKILQEVIINQAISMIQKREIISSGIVRVARISDAANQAFFTTPHTLAKLAHFIVDIMIEAGREKKPLVIAVLKQNTYLVCGVPGTHSSVALTSNTIGDMFRKASDFTGANQLSERFDTSVVEVAKDDIEKFLDFIRSGISQM